jgi:AcrR family transcriptional regulator
MSSPAPEAARVGRPRDPKCDSAIVEATLALLAEGGYGAMTMEAVAARAGVGKATLYRRYSGKEQLVVDAVATLTEPPDPVTGVSVRDELVALLDAMRRRSTSSLPGRVFPRLVGASVDNPELMARYREQVIEPRRRRFAAVLRRGVEEGLLRPGLDVEHAIDLLVGPMAYRNMVRSDAPPPAGLAERIVDDVLAGIGHREDQQ